MSANLAAKYHDPLSVGVGAVAALWVAAGQAVIGGRSLLKVIPVKWLTRAAAAVMLALAGATLAALFQGTPLAGEAGQPGMPVRACRRGSPGSWLRSRSGGCIWRRARRGRVRRT